MIIGSGRKKQVSNQTINKFEQVRKFGNIINRFDKPIHSGKKGQIYGNNQYDGIQNITPITYDTLGNNQVIKSYIGRNLQDIQFQQITPQKIYTNDGYKKESTIYRNREFDQKVDNINKIHEQISCLLKYVKNGQSKSAVKYKDSTQNKGGRVQDLIKQRTKDGSIKPKKGELTPKRSYFEQKLGNQQISMTPQKQKIGYTYQRVNEENKINEQKYKNKIQKYYEQKPRKQFNYQKLNIQGKKLNEIPQKNKASILNFNYQINQKKAADNTKLFSYRQMQNSNTIKIPLCTQVHTPKKNSKKVQEANPPKKFYQYNFDSGNQQALQIVKSKNVDAKNQKPQKIEKSFINLADYDQQISKVRQRIKNSQQMMKKMEQRYLGFSHQPSVKSKQQNPVSQIKIFQSEHIQQNANNQQPRSRISLQKLSHLNKSNIASKTAKRTIQAKTQQKPESIQLSKEQICNMIADKLSAQIKLDQKLRDARQIFNQCKTTDKWKMLQQKLNHLGFSFTHTELQNQLSISSNQYNPFIDTSNYSVVESVEELAQCFKKSEQYWDKQLYKFISKDVVQNSGFNIQEIDLDHRGYLTVEDLVCFINLYTTNFFRNRDLIYLFKRIMAFGKNRNGVQYDCFMEILTNP